LHVPKGDQIKENLKKFCWIRMCRSTHNDYMCAWLHKYLTKLHII
jgi:hypothetical protein